MSKAEIIAIKGERDGLHLFCAENVYWDEIIQEIKKKLGGAQQRFFAGANVIVEVGDRQLTAEEVSQLWTVLLACDLKIKGIKVGGTKETGVVREQRISETEYLSQKPLYIGKRSLRSGQKITLDGHVLLWGDVNPGAEIVATGIILVLGALRGLAHAGATGDERAWVLALRLQPTQLRIADCITRAPAEKPREPEIAQIRSGVIVCETL